MNSNKVVLYIPCVPADYSMFDLFDLFYTNGIATVSHISYIPYYNSSYEIINQVYITVHNWHDTEIAYNFIKAIHANYDDAHYKLIYNTADETWFPVSLYKYTIIPHHAYTIYNCLIIDTPTHYSQTLDLANLPKLHKQLDLLTL
jgi:hypothetical protein